MMMLISATWSRPSAFSKTLILSARDVSMTMSDDAYAFVTAEAITTTSAGVKS